MLKYPLFMYKIKVFCTCLKGLKTSFLDKTYKINDILYNTITPYNNNNNNNNNCISINNKQLCTIQYCTSLNFLIGGGLFW